MKKKLTNTRVINSIGIGILAAITAGTPAVAALNNSLSEDNAIDPLDASASESQAEPVETLADSQNTQIIESISDAQETIQEVRDDLNQISAENGNNPEAEGGESEEPSGGGENVIETPQTSAEPEESSEQTNPADGSQLSGDSETQPGETDGQVPPAEIDLGTTVTPPEGTDSETPSTPPQDVVLPSEENGNSEAGNIPQTPEDSEIYSRIDEHLEKTQNALENLKKDSDIVNLDKKNEEARDAIDNFNETVENPNNFIGSVADTVSDASSAVVDAVASVTADEKVAKDQAQVAIDAQVKVYDSREEAAAAQQQAQAAAAEAEAAYNSALVTVEEAENNKAIADERLADLERQLVDADAALSDMQIKVQEAQEALIAVQEKYGLKPGEFNPEDLDGEAREAYDNVQSALTLAAAEFDYAQANYDAAAGEVQKEKDNYKNAAKALEDLNNGLATAKNAADEAADAFDQEKFNTILTEYNIAADDKEVREFDVEQAKSALEKAQEALNKAAQIKQHTDDVVNKAEDAVQAANEKEATKIQEAEEAVKQAEQAVQDNEKNIDDYFKLVEQAKTELEEVKKVASRAAESLSSVKAEADRAQEDLDQKEEALKNAETALAEAEGAYAAAEAEVEAIKSQVLSIQENNVREAQKDAMSGDSEDELNLAKELILYEVFKEHKTIKNIEIIKGDKNEQEIVFTELDGEKKTYRYSKTDERGIEIEEKTEDGYMFYTSEQNFNTAITRKLELSNSGFENAQRTFMDAQKDLGDAQEALKIANDNVLAAIEAKKTADENAAEVEPVAVALQNMAEALENVYKEADELVKAEAKYREDYKQNPDNIIGKLDDLISNGITLKTVNDKLKEVENAKDAVMDVIDALTELSLQENADMDAYKRLENAYNTAQADCVVAAKALEKCVEGLNSARTEKDRARIAASAIFSYISDGNVRPVTPTEPTTPTQPTPTEPAAPTQPTPVQPVTPIQPADGNQADGSATPAIADTGVSSGAGNTGYMGYTYTTVGGQTAYTAPLAEAEPAADELVNVQDEAVPLAQVDADNKKKTNSTKTTRKVSDEKVPLADVETEKNKISWWWILVIALLGATGTELYIRHKDKEEEKKARSNKQDLVKI